MERDANRPFNPGLGPFTPNEAPFIGDVIVAKRPLGRPRRGEATPNNPLLQPCSNPAPKLQNTNSSPEDPACQRQALLAATPPSRSAASAFASLIGQPEYILCARCAAVCAPRILSNLPIRMK